MAHDNSQSDALRLRGAVFDLDGVLTRTERLHVTSWKAMIDAYLRERATRTGEPFEAFDADTDYRRWVDGKPRFKGLASFLESRRIELPMGEPTDPAERETVCGLGNRKQAIFRRMLERQGAEVIEPAVELLDALRRAGVAVGMATSSRNGRLIVERAGLDGLFAASLDGVESAELGLAGKPDPDLFVETARRLGVETPECVVFEDALAGVEAGRRGGFGLVVGVARAGQAHRDLLAAGADLVSEELADLTVSGIDAWLRCRQDRRPSALGSFEELASRLAGRRPAVFLDYDGTLTPIVRRPEDAVLAPGMRRVLGELAKRFPTAVVSGRGRRDVEDRVGLPELTYAGSHGFDIAGPDGEVRYAAAEEVIPVIEAATQQLEDRLAGVTGAQVEPKTYTVAVHYRRVADDELEAVEAAVDQVVAEHPELRKAGGKMVFEIRPDLDWDKGRAVEWLLETLELGGEAVCPLYVGDDETDEDAFRALAGRGIGILVSDLPTPTGADYHLRNPGEVGELLTTMVRELGAPGP